MKFETHTHSLCSSCGNVDPEFLVERYKNAGYGGLFLTNHYSSHAYSDWWKGDSHREKVDYFFSVIDRARKACIISGLKFMFAVEVEAFCNPVAHSEYILYGIDEKTIYDSKPLFEFTQKELFKLSEKKGFFMCKVYPFREREVNVDPAFMHGAESFNGHYHHVNNNEKAKAFCVENGLIEMSGTDFHHADQPITAGIYLPDGINTESQFVEYIFSGKQQLICDKEL